MTSNLDTPHKDMNRNPTGKGGFGDRPEDINRSGYWSSKDSISYQYKRFLKMTPKELKAYKNIPEEERTVAMDIAYSQVIKSRNSLNHTKEITDRTEGKAQQYIDITSQQEKITGLDVRLIGNEPNSD